MKKTFEIVLFKPGRKYSRSLKYKDKSILYLSKFLITFYENIINKLELKKGSELLLSRSNDIWYIGDVTNHDYYVGSRLIMRKNPKTLYMCSTGYVKKGMKSGVYELTEDTIYDDINNIDWYELKFIE